MTIHRQPHTFKEWLVQRNACEPAIKWVGSKDAEQAWEQCEHPWWLVWYIIVTHIAALSEVDEKIYKVTGDRTFRCYKDNPLEVCRILRESFTFKLPDELIESELP